MESTTTASSSPLTTTSAMAMVSGTGTTAALITSVLDQLTQYRASLASVDVAGSNSGVFSSSVSSSLSSPSAAAAAAAFLTPGVSSSINDANNSIRLLENAVLGLARHFSTATSGGANLSDVVADLPMPADEAALNSGLGLGPIRDPLWTAIPMTILYVVILVTGLIGNCVTCVVIARNRYMHTATNYYLFSLAISDLLLLMLGLPQEIQQIWQRYPYAFGEAFCVLRGFSSEASTNSSVLTITAFTVERYLAICHPLRAHTMSKLSRAVKFIVAIWIVGFLCAAPIAYQMGIVFDYVHDEVVIPQSAACNVKRSVPYLQEHIFALQSLLVFVLPVTMISVLYVLIGIKLRQSAASAKCELKTARRRPIRRLYSAVNPNKNSNSNGNKLIGSSIDSLDHSSENNNNNNNPPQTQVTRPRLAKFASSTSSASSATSHSSSSLAQRRAVIKMLTAVVVAFFVCFAPFHAQRLMAIYVKNPSSPETFAFNLLTYISGVTYYLSATINPILYSIMSVKFRQAFHDTFVRTFCPSRASPSSTGPGSGRHRSMSQSYASMYQQQQQHAQQHQSRRFSDSQRKKQAVQQFDSVYDDHDSPPSDRYMLATAVVVLHPVNIVTHGIMKNGTHSTSAGSNNNLNAPKSSASSGASNSTSGGSKIMFSLIQEESELSQNEDTLE